MLTIEEYEAKRTARYERLTRAALKAESESAASWKQASLMASVIPFGQPILVGHHSESRDRNYRARIESKHRKGYELHQKAEYYQERAEAAANNNAIFSDDPQAIEKIEEKIARLEKRQELMKAANKLIKKNDRAGLAALGFSEGRIEQLFTPDCFGNPGFESFTITNNGANIRRLKERAAIVARKQAAEDREESVGDVRIEYSPSENRVRIHYPGRVDPETFKLLRQHGFRVLRSEGEGVFSAYYNNNALYFVKIHIKKES